MAGRIGVSLDRERHIDIPIAYKSLKVREQRREAIRTELNKLRTPRRVKVRDTLEIRAELVEYLQSWRDMARQGVAEARRLLRTVLVGRFVFTPVTPPPDLPPRKGPGRKPRLIYELRGEATLSGLIAGLISASSVVAPTGFEPALSRDRSFANAFASLSRDWRSETRRD